METRYQTGVEVPLKMRLTARAKKALQYIGDGCEAVVMLQFDDGPQDYKTREQLKEIAGNVGMDWIETNGYHVCYLISEPQEA